MRSWCLECASGTRVRAGQLTADTTTVYALTDKTGEYELYAYDLLGKTEPTKMRHGISSPILDFRVSPNSSDILIRTITGELFHSTRGTNEATQVDLESRTQPEEISWSASGRYATFVTFTDFDIGRVTVFDTVCKTVDYLTSGRYEVSAPTFGPDDRSILLIADVNFRSTVNDTWAPTSYWPSFDKRSVLHTVPFSGSPEQEATVIPEATPEFCETQNTENDDPRHRPLMRELPFVAGNFEGLATNGDSVWVFSKLADRDLWGQIITFSLSFDGHRSAPRVPFRETIDTYAFSPRSTALIAMGPDGVFLSRLGIDGRLSGPDYVLNNFSATIEVDLVKEREQMFRDLWRLYRDFFWDPDMNGVDWVAQYQHYRKYLNIVSDRAEFNDLTGYMVSELGAGHTSLARASAQGQISDEIAKLGALFEDKDGVFVSSIFDGDLDIADERSPFTDVSPPIEVGDRITHFNRAPVRTLQELQRMLVGKVGQSVLLDIERNDGTNFRHRVSTISAADEAWLRGKAWAARNARLTEELSDGRVGYIHMAAAYADDFSDFVRQYSHLHRREALILDLRGNSGGNDLPPI